jgi:hypothetical protein
MRREICIRQIELSSGIRQMELSCVGPNQNQTPTLGLKKLGPKRGGKQGELAGTCTCLKCILLHAHSPIHLVPWFVNIYLGIPNL